MKNKLLFIMVLMEGCSEKDVYTENYTLKVDNNHWELISRQVKMLHLLAYQCQ